ncbi:Zinc finger fyve domain-containing protein 26 isoform, partial [Thalictrum thalictroides]
YIPTRVLFDILCLEPEWPWNLTQRSRECDSDSESEIDDKYVSGRASTTSPKLSNEPNATNEPSQDSPKSNKVEVDTTVLLSFDWENEGPYEKAVKRLIHEGNLMDALALSDRCLRDGASDQLLQLLIECGEDNQSTSWQSQGYGAHTIWSNSWQYCL